MTKTLFPARSRDTADGTPPAGDHFHSAQLGQLFYDADGSGGGAAILFATLQGAPVLSANDFQVI